MLIFSPRKLVAKRKERGYTRDQVALSAYCTTKAYEDWERGIDEPSEWWLARLAKALGCKPADLYSDI